MRVLKREVVRIIVLTGILRRDFPNSDYSLENEDQNMRHDELNKFLVYLLLFFDEMSSPSVLFQNSSYFLIP